MGYIGSDPKTNESVSTAQLVDDSVTNAKIVDNVLFTSVTSSVVSASGTITADTFTGTFSGALSSSAQIATSISGSSTSLSSSLATRTTTLESASGSFSTRVTTIEGSGTAQGVGTSDSPTFNNITATGTVTAQEFHSEFVSASITFTSGSHKFGDSADDIQQMTGSLRITGSGDHYFQTGKVGIGTASPEAVLTTTPESGNFNSTYNNYDGVGLFLRGNGTSGDGNYGPALVFGSADSDVLNQENKHSAISLVQTGSDPNQTGLAFWTHSSGTSTDALVESMRITSDGNVGIGTGSPTIPLVVGANGDPTQATIAAFINTNDGGVASILIQNDAGGGSTDETNEIVSRTSNRRNGKIVFGREADQSSTANADSFLQLHTATNNVNNVALHIDSSQRVGIGTTSPTTKVDIASTSFGLPATSGTTPAGMFRIGYNDRSWGGNENMMGIINSGTNGYAFYMQTKVPTNYALHRPTFLNPQGGYVAINSLSGSSGGFAGGVPAQPLHVHGKGGDPVTSGTYTDSTVGSIRLSGNSGQYCVLDMGINDSNDYAWLQAYRANSLHIEDDIILNPNGGNVGVGVKGSGYPASTLHLGADPTVELRFEDTGQPAVMLQIISAEYTGTSPYNNNRFIALNSSNITFEVGGSERMRIDSSGNVGIGDDSPGVRLTVLTDSAGGYAASFHNDGNNANRYGIRVSAGTDNGSGNNYHFSAMDGDNDLEGALRVDNGTFSLYDNSDRRLKDNIRDTEINGTDIVNSIKVRDFEWKKSGLTETAGFVAQELKESFEPASPDSEDDLYEGKPKMMSVSRDRLVPVLVKAIQELSAKVEALES